MYRPEDTCLTTREAFSKDLNLVYWSDDVITIDISKVQGKCVLRCETTLDEPVDLWVKQGDFRFYFNQAYSRKERSFDELSSKAEKYGRAKGVGKGKGKSSGAAKDESASSGTSPPEDPFAYPKISRPLRCLDVFAGCGGLSLGLHQAGVAETHWAIELFQPAAKAFKENNPKCTVFTDDCNLLLKLALEGKTHNDKKERLPAKGEVRYRPCGIII